MLPSNWFTTIKHVLDGETEFKNSAILPAGTLISGAELIASNTEKSQNVLMVVSNVSDHATVSSETTFVRHVRPMDQNFKWYNGRDLIWSPRDPNAMAYICGLMRNPLNVYNRERPSLPTQLSAVVFAPVQRLTYSFDRERARAVFMVAHHVNPDVVLFGDGIATHEESMRMILEERRQIAPMCRIAFIDV